MAPKMPAMDSEFIAIFPDRCYELISRNSKVNVGASDLTDLNQHMRTFPANIGPTHASGAQGNHIRDFGPLGDLAHPYFGAALCLMKAVTISF
jgi:hypothetical protein